MNEFEPAVAVMHALACLRQKRTVESGIGESAIAVAMAQQLINGYSLEIFECNKVLAVCRADFMNLADIRMLQARRDSSRAEVAAMTGEVFIRK